jgi:putative intracellular protease/amidase
VICADSNQSCLRTDLRLAGAEALDEQVLVDGQFTTSRSPADLPAFCPAIIDHFATSQGGLGRRRLAGTPRHRQG